MGKATNHRILLLIWIAMLAAALAFGLAAAFVPPTTLQPTRPVVSNVGEVCMAAKKAAKKPKPLSPKSNYPSTKNIQIQKSGFGSFLPKFERASSTAKSKYGMPVFLPNGNVNPAYLAAERKALTAQSKKNMQAEAAKTKKMKAAKTFELADFIRKKVGNVGSGKDYYQSGR